MSGLVFFTANEPQHGRELWVSDGTTAGTRLVIDSVPGDGGILGSGLGQLDEERLLFLSDGKVWITDGTTAGTEIVREIGTPSGPGASLTVWAGGGLGNGKVLFAGAGSNGSGHGLWVSDGTAAGTQLLADIGVVRTALLPGGRMVMIANEEATGRELWVSDGTPGGTRQLMDFLPGAGDGVPANAQLLPTGAGVVLLRARDDDSGSDWLWATDGAEVQPVVEARLRSVDNMPQPDGTYRLEVFDPDKGSLEFLTDGTEAGTIAIPPARTNDAPAPVGYQGPVGGTPYPMYAPSWGWQLGDGRVVYSADTQSRIETQDSGVRTLEYGSQLWATDGTQGGTVMLPRINQGPPRGSDPNPPWAPSSGPGAFHAMMDGRVLFTAGDGSSGGLFVTDGNSIDRLTPPQDGVYFRIIDGMSTVYHNLADGRVLFVDRNSDTLWITDGTRGGTQPLAEGITRIADLRPLPDGVVMFGAEGDGAGLWATDGSAGGTVQIVADRTPGTFVSLAAGGMPGEGPWVFDARLPRDGPFQETELWITDGTASSTRLLNPDLVAAQFRDAAPLGDGRFVLRHVFDHDPAMGSAQDYEPAVIDLRSGSLTLLKDIYPGFRGSDPAGFTAVMAGPQAPLSDLFAEAFATPDEPVLVPIAPFFTAPDGASLSLTVTGLPAGLRFDPASGSLQGQVTAAPDVYEVEVEARSASGGSTTASFDFTVIDTGLLRLVASAGWERAEMGGPITTKPGGTLTIGRKDGAEAILRVEKAKASIADGKIKVEGEVFSALHETEKPLFVGEFAVAMQNADVSELKPDAAADTHGLLGGWVSLGYSQMALRPEEVTFDADLGFQGMFAAFDTVNAPLSISYDVDGLRFGASLLGTGRWSPDIPVQIVMPGGSLIDVGLENIGVFYDTVSDRLYLNGKGIFSWGGTVAAQYSFLDPSRESKLTIDLAGDTPADQFYAKGDKFLRLGRDGDRWDWDIVGEIKYEGQSSGTLPAGTPQIKELTFSLDTTKSSLGGSFKGKLPFLIGDVELEAGIGARWNPAQLDSLTFGIDGLNQPLGATGLFVQGGKLAAENLSARSPGDDPSYSAEITSTLGPNTQAVPSPVRGSLKGELKAGNVTVTLEKGTQVGYLLPGVVEAYATPLINWFGVKPEDVLGFQLKKVTGTLTMDFARASFGARLDTELLGGIYSGSSAIEVWSAGGSPALSVATTGQMTFPEPLPLVGGRSLGGSAMVAYSHDGDFSNDFVAAWTIIDLPGGRFTGSVGAGVRLGLDGSFALLGRRGIDAIGSWELAPEMGTVILSAYWETPADGVTLELIAPDKTVIPESEFASRDDIALVETLNGPTARHVALADPAAGIWDLRVADPAGLGTVRTEASDMLPAALTRIESVTLDGIGAMAALGADPAGGQVSLFVAVEKGAPAGLVLAEPGPLAPGTTESVALDLSGLAPGEWWLHARTENGAAVPGLDVFAEPIVVTGAADLRLGIEEGMDRDSGARILTVAVTNEGDRASAAGELRITAPEAVLGGPALDGFLPLGAAQTALVLPTLAAGDRAEFALALPAELNLPLEALRFDAETPSWDATPTANSLVYFLTELFGDALGGGLVGRDGTPVAEFALSLRLPDGSVVEAVTDAAGRFGFETADLVGATLSGPGWSAADGPRITTASALDTLRMAVGLQPSWGPAAAEDFIAADINGDGQVTTSDALEILRTAVGLSSEHAPRWIFIETGRDFDAEFGQVTRSAVPTDLAPDFATHPDPADLTLTALLTGQVQSWT